MEKFRKTSQYLLPLEKPDNTPGQYDVYPTFNLGNGKIKAGFHSLADEIAREKTVVIDGYIGVLFDLFKQELNLCLQAKGIQAVWWDIRAALKSEEEINT